MCEEGLIFSVYSSTANFLCESDFIGKHLSDPTGLQHIAPREPRILTLTTKFDSMVWPHCWVVMRAAVLRTEGEAMRTKEWGAAWTTTVGERGCWSVAVAHEFMKLLWGLVFAYEGALAKDL